MTEEMSFRQWFIIYIFLMLTMANVAVADDNLWAKLKEGGKVVLMRHADVNKGAGSGNPLVRDASCKQERNLSDKGRRSAALLGKKFDALDIPISDIRHSPFCRTSETAQIVFKRGSPDESLSLLEVLEAKQAEIQTGKLEQLIGSFSGKGNLILITHEPNISRVAFESLKTLELLVLQPDGGDEFIELGVIKKTK